MKIAYFAHSLRSDWNNGNAHFLRGLLRALGAQGHQVVAFEPQEGWSLANLRAEPAGETSLAEFSATYPELRIETYAAFSDSLIRRGLADCDAALLHEWNEPELAQQLLMLRNELGYKLLFHDTHHRASSSPATIAAFGLARFDGVVVFGESLRRIYRERFGLERVWVLHEAADTTFFRPAEKPTQTREMVWIGNWGEGERSNEIRRFLLEPAARLRHTAGLMVYGVRYPQEGLDALCAAGARYGGYLPNLRAPEVYAGARLTVHVPRQQYGAALEGIPTIRVFEALACGIPLISAPWRDTENLFTQGDFLWARDTDEMTAAMKRLLDEDAFAKEQAARGLATVLSRHTCAHRAQELTAILEEVR